MLRESLCRGPRVGAGVGAKCVVYMLQAERSEANHLNNNRMHLEDQQTHIYIYIYIS